jgi:DNA-binding transcriptional LysR family regulator
MRKIVETAVVLRDGRAQPNGLLRVNAPTLFAQMMMGRLAAEFTRSYPDVTLAIALDDRQVNLVDEGYDLGLRFRTCACGRSMLNAATHHDFSVDLPCLLTATRAALKASDRPQLIG